MLPETGGILTMCNAVKTYCLIFFLFFVTWCYFFQGGSWGVNSRICLLQALLQQQTFSIDAYKEDSIDPEFSFVNTGDWSFKDGHYYSNKAPGLTFMALVPFGITKQVIKRIYPQNIEKQIFISTYVSTIFTTGLCSALLCLLIFYLLNNFFQLNIKQSIWLTLFYGFGTLGFSYSTTLYSHIPAAFFGFFSFVCILILKHTINPHSKKLGFLAGFSASTAVLIEPSTVFVLGFLFIYLASFAKGRSQLLMFCVGCVPPACLQFINNFACFGNPLASGYNYSNPAVMFSHNGKLFGFPNPINVLRILFLPDRGLFTSSPVLLMTIPGCLIFIKSKKWRAEALFCLAVTGSFLLFIISYYAWHHASTPGPRYLLPILPFMFLLSVFAIKKMPRLFSLLGLISIVINLAITLVGNEVDHDMANPLRDFVLKNILDGNVSVNRVPFSNFSAYPSIYKLNTLDCPPNFSSFNLGEFIFPHQITSILPLFIFWILWWVLWKKTILSKKNE
jgi:hypothetical protein